MFKPGLYKLNYFGLIGAKLNVWKGYSLKGLPEGEGVTGMASKSISDYKSTC